MISFGGFSYQFLFQLSEALVLGNKNLYIESKNDLCQINTFDVLLLCKGYF